MACSHRRFFDNMCKFSLDNEVWKLIQKCFLIFLLPPFTKCDTSSSSYVTIFNLVHVGKEMHFKQNSFYLQQYMNQAEQHLWSKNKLDDRMICLVPPFEFSHLYAYNNIYNLTDDRGKYLSWRKKNRRWNYRCFESHLFMQHPKSQFEECTGDIHKNIYLFG